ncbi:midasin isoform X2 [Syzygium oleosum]|uniref:midasin isoform X2 n=1 Tax=Syzygium oleosum TaxID=219896 RepID=UPI0024BBAAAA|nr:midasin isoform X2 [Syzygium oleosum]
MAIDGSFSLEFALRRFLARCPELRSRPRFAMLAREGSVLHEDEVIVLVADIFLHPTYTIPLMGCFRPIARKIVEKAVSSLRLVTNLRSNSSSIQREVDEDNEILKGAEDCDGNLIDCYVRKGKGLNLHELACLGFCRALDLAPFLLGSLLEFFKFAPPPFQRILEGGRTLDYLQEAEGQLSHVVRISYRILLTSPEVFSKLWDWSCFMDLARQSTSLSGSSKSEKDIADLRWCISQILSVILKLGDAGTLNLGIGPEEGFDCLLRWEKFCRDVSLEKAGIYIEPSVKIESDEIVDVHQECCLESCGLISLGLQLFSYSEAWPRHQRLATGDDEAVNAPFVLTSTTRRSFQMVLLAVSQRWPVLLYGPSGVGKSALVSKLACDSGNRVLSIQMDDQIDSKTLIGSYVCTEKPGEFRWQPGSLTQAIENGLWVVFEDIDKAPSDVHSILLPLLEGARSFVTGHSEEITIAENFRLFSTISTSRLHMSSGTGGFNFAGTLWRRVMVRQPTHEHLQCIVKTWYPRLDPLVDRLVETFENINAAIMRKIGDSVSVGRFSTRDLLKWCKRIEGLGFSLMDDQLSSYQCHCIYQEAVDVFSAFSTSVENRLKIKKNVARLWGVPISEAERLHPDMKPVIQDMLSELRIGRVTLQRAQKALHYGKKPFVEIRRSLHAIERIACSVKCNEPVLLVGETGTGKTTLVQNLASRLGQKLTVLNLSQQSDIADLLGGFKPLSAHYVCIPLYKEFEELFSKTFSAKVNLTFLDSLRKHLSDKNWKVLLNGMHKGVDAFKQSKVEDPRHGKKRKKPLNEEVINAWNNFSMKLEAARAQIGASSAMIFSFVEGAFVNALRNGQWILLDEVNLAPTEILQRITGVLEGENGSLCLAERGDISYIKRHPNFRIFACMNPATDAGKRELPYSLRTRFTEYFIDDDLDEEDLTLFVNQFLEGGPLKREMVDKIVRFYKAAKKESEERLQDGANQKPQFSLRSLFRALEYTRKAEKKFTFEKALYDGFCMFFLTLLDRSSGKIMNQMILSYLLGGKMPGQKPFDCYVTIMANSVPDDFVENYVLTKSVREQLGNLARAVFIKRYPVLLQGPTSSGKTSLVRYLAAVTGNEFVRINNHEHTDLQEYLGSYVTDTSGKLVFHEGVLVRAVRNGYWIVLDELNLAPSDVLEALNRLLDDNRELFVPELQETIKAHPNFMLFATQNPPTVYGGRKMLSRAFRNRFVEIHVEEIPEEEISIILENRCKISGSYAKKMVEVMKDLQLHRQGSNVFAGKHGFITPRDLFRWANRVRLQANTFEDCLSSKHRYEDLAREGYYLLAERLRDDDEKSVVKDVLKKHFHVVLDDHSLYKQESSEGRAVNLDNISDVSENFGNVTWTRSMWRLYFLIRRCYELREPILLVGETGGGKTTVCQLLSTVLKSKLHILNCHQYTETSDFVGGFYPVRERSRLISEFKRLVEQVMLSDTFVFYPSTLTISSDIGQASSTLNQLAMIINSYRQGLVTSPRVTSQDLDYFEQTKVELEQLYQKWQTIFMWQDGPLVQAMRAGHLFLVDEISLANDSVLERLNSVLEPERTLSLPEKGGSTMEKVTAHNDFILLATMNPGGDYGKKELSPALRNRFTEIWVPSVGDPSELRSISQQSISKPELLFVVDPMINFWAWFNRLQTGRTLTVRDLLSWVSFINETERNLGAKSALLHGSFLVLLDGLTLGTGISKSDAEELKDKCLHFLLGQLEVDENSADYPKLSRIENYGWGETIMAKNLSGNHNVQLDNIFGVDPFYIEKGHENCEVGGFEFLAPTTRRNALRVLRAMQLRKPVLLEGSPGVGKTSLVVALGKFSGHRVVRINLSEQTDMMDLLGSDLPVDSDEGMKFAWSDGILLQALKEGCWVLLDELNLAPQSVLEGLNAVLDHRAEIYIPELDLTFKCPPSFRIFACQNPSSQGGGRKGLPKSFLNRFTKVYVDELVEDDYLSICSSLYPSIPRSLLSKLILFNKRLYEETMIFRKFAQDGSPWEFNLRDVIRSCQIIQDAPVKSKDDCFLNLVYVQRMRTATDRKEVLRLYEQVFEVKPFVNPFPRVQLTSHYLIVGNSSIRRNNEVLPIVSNKLKIVPGIRQNLEAAADCVKYQWLCILIGPSSSGKTSLIRILAQLTGNALNELNLSSATDISELLGCFEQYSIFRNLRYVASQIEHYMNELCRLQVEYSMEAFISGKKDFISEWQAFLSHIDSGNLSRSDSGNLEERISSSFSVLIKIVDQLKLDREESSLPLSWSMEELDNILIRIVKLKKLHQRMTFSAKFEWVTGVLVRAIENGEWIVLEDANLCNPTVLDRINSLVEPSGSITINECGTVDGKPVVLHPHPNFRLFLTVNPNHGDVSRAMRNRGVEIFMMPPLWLLDWKSGCYVDEMELKDVKRFLVESGIPIGGLADAMAKAHIYARDEGLRVHVQVTNFELARWIQLFQRLLAEGNRPLWSLQISWEHTYLSSFGEFEGETIISHAKHAFLSGPAFHIAYPGYPLFLPGGWPLPLNLGNFVHYSKETSIKQNCMYVEFLGARCAYFECKTTNGGYYVDQALGVSGSAMPYLMDIETLLQIMFPKDTNQRLLCHGGKTTADLALASKMLLFAVNWAIEQATDSDLNLYLHWFSWFDSQLHPFCQTFSSFLTSFRKESKHPIWIYITSCSHKLRSLGEINRELHPVPLLSSELVDLVALSDASAFSSTFLWNAIRSVVLLRHSYQQWTSEKRHNLTGEFKNLRPLLKSLRILEKQILNILIESPSFDVLFKLYSRLLEDHMQFWESVVSSQFETLLVFWRSLLKVAEKLQVFHPQAASTIAALSRNLVGASSWNLRPDKSLLWVNCGHPLSPHSADVYHKQLNISKLCESIWKHSGDRIDLIASSCLDLRILAMQGVCLALQLSNNCNEDQNLIVQQLDEIHEKLLERFEYEKHKVETSMTSDEDACIEADSAACCVLLPQILCSDLGFSCWTETRPMNDCTSFFLDTQLLQNLSSIVLIGPGESHQALSSVSHLLESSLNFSLTFSSRPPQMFSPHQKALWTLDSWMSIDAVDVRIAAIVLEMWCMWHASLWSLCFPSFTKSSSHDGYDIPLPDVIMQPLRTAMTLQMQQRSFTVKDYSAHCLKVRVASSDIWRSTPPETDILSFLLSSARVLLSQIIFAHQKSFHPEKFAEIKSIIYSLHESGVKENSIQLLSTLILSSSHEGLRHLMQTSIEPAFRELYVHCSRSDDYVQYLGHAWLHIGGVRYHLLVNSDDLDPALKYSCKQSFLAKKISLLELEIEVRKECNYLAGSFSARQDDKQRLQVLEHLERERDRNQRKVVFRSDPRKYRKLRGELNDFSVLVKSLMLLLSNIEETDSVQIIQQVCDWQKTSTSFIDRMSREYIEYLDIVQPVQVAVYEIKLGLSLVLSSILKGSFLKKLLEDNMEQVLETLHMFMRFPRCGSNKSVDVKLISGLLDVSSYELDFPSILSSADVTLLEKLVSVACVIDADEMDVSTQQLKASVQHNILVRIAHYVANSRLMSDSSFMIMEKIFATFANLWMAMKVKAKIKEESSSQQFKFKPRAFDIDTVVEVNIASLGQSFASESFLEWQQLAAEEESTERANEVESVDDAWSSIQEPILSDMVQIHNQLFGSIDLRVAPGSFRMSDENILRNFMESYRLGAGMIKDLGSPNLASLDTRLMPEHLLNLSLSHVSSTPSGRGYNFYKDSNVRDMDKMVKLLLPLEKVILALMSEWEDHPGLQKILDVIRMLLALPVNTPLAKALSGLQFLLNRAHVLHDSMPRLSLSDQLEPIVGLVSSWQKKEFECWPVLLDEVQDQYDMNAAKLWFPLYTVIYSHSADISSYDESTIQSLEDFIQTSNVGEFRRRIQLILAFHGQINTGLRLGIYSSSGHKENLKVLYNLFGLNMQFLPIILEYMEASRSSIEMEIKELMKLYKWEERVESCLSIETSKRMRHRFRKLMQKYSDVLQQSVKSILNQKTGQSGIDAQCLRSPNFLHVFPDDNIGMLSAAFDVTAVNNKDRFVWYTNWMMKVYDVSENLHTGMTPESVELLSRFKHSEEANIIRKCPATRTVVYEEEWKDLWSTLENVSRAVLDCGNLWKDVTKTIRKRRAMADLLKYLESSGLSRHMSKLIEDQLDSSWLHQSSHIMGHLLSTCCGLSSWAVDISSPFDSQGVPIDTLDSEWKIANEYYFKSIASMQLLQHIRLNFHKDFTLEQVTRSFSFVCHLIVIQEEQRDAMYDLAHHMKCLRGCVSTLEHVSSDSPLECTIARNQHATLECLWQQKQLFDSLWAMLRDGSLLLKEVQNTHLNNCQSVRAAANEIRTFFERFIPVIHKSKEALDHSLLGRDGVVNILNRSLDALVISTDEERLVFQNFEVLKEFEEHLISFRNQCRDGSSVRFILLGCLDYILKQGKQMQEQFTFALGARMESTSSLYSELEAEFRGALTVAYEHVMHVLQKLTSVCDGCDLSKESQQNITSWKTLFKACATDLNIGPLCDNTFRAICLAEKLINFPGQGNAGLSLQIGLYFNKLRAMLNVLLDFGNALLRDLLSVNRTISLMTHTLAKDLALLYSRGFGTSLEDQEDESGHATSQNDRGTGMGEGEGINDVSDQIIDEDQLLGDSAKPGEEQNASTEVPNKNEKGIEMEQDFAADTFSVSQDSTEDDTDNSDGEELESAMGKNGDDSEVVDERLWNKDDDNSQEKGNEKHESGPSVRDRDENQRELRAKEEGPTVPDEAHSNNAGETNDAAADKDNLVDVEDMDTNMEDEKADMDISGLEVNELNQTSEEGMQIDDEVNDIDAMEEAGQEEQDEPVENGYQQENTDAMDESLEEADIEQATETSRKDDGDAASDDSQAMDLTAEKDFPSKESSRKDDDYVPTADSGVQLRCDLGASDSANERPEMNWSNSGNTQNEVAPGRNSPSGTEPEVTVPDSSQGGKLSDDRPKHQLPMDEPSPLQRPQPNPYRSIGDALEGWKERAKIPVDIQEDKKEAQDEMEDGNADEYAFVSEGEKGTAQALGPATAEQIEHQIDGDMVNEKNSAVDRTDEVAEMETEMQSSEEPRHNFASITRKKSEESSLVSDLDKLPNEGSPHGQDPRESNPGNLSESLVRINKVPTSDDILQLGEMSIGVDNLQNGPDSQDISSDARDDAASLWTRYELRTTRLSQELAEQLRLVMEPTLASKLRGDYKTGKRINMKKVIPYIASHYRKDKIWLRRTRPDKRDYQVVIAIDDSRSMSESGCGDVAVEALVTVCRALSQLEMGNLAVASFGKKGNIRLLHDFDLPFTREAGIKMISSLTFKQENTIVDEPVVDLLKHLNKMLDVAVARARLPSGQNPLQQLVLIIADGRFHEKESLKRRVRDFLNSKRLVAFLLLDSPEESIMDLMEATFQGANIKFSKYLDSFPFPYYILLRNIEALPRTLADLLRQWFELMQSSRD